MGWAVTLHGGAGDISVSMPADIREAREECLRNCLNIGVSALKANASALDVVELVVCELENHPLFNAGRGSVSTTDGTVEMDGNTKNCGAVSGLSTVVSAISLARLVMEKTPHIYLAFDGAEAFMRKRGVEIVDPSYFITPANIERLKKVQPWESSSRNINRWFSERISDTPVVGAGNYANCLCAVSATGKGESIIRANVARDVAALMEYKGLSLKDAAASVVEKKRSKR